MIAAGLAMERARDLLRDSVDFLGAARDLLKTKRWSKVCFNCQQSAELALKAALNSLGLERKGHSLQHLLAELSRHKRGIRRFGAAVRILDQYYIPTRYANAFSSGAAYEHYTKQQALEALKIAKKVLAEARRIVAKREAKQGPR